MEVFHYEGEVITEPGIYIGVPMSAYHSDLCDGPSISSSGLRTIDLESPLHYWDRSYLNPDREESDDSGAEAVHFRLGRAGHTLMLEPEKFADQFVTRPPIFDSWRTKAAKEWRADQYKAGKTVLDPTDMIRVRGIGEALRRHRWHVDGILGGVIEASIFVKDPKTGVWLKSRPDSIPLDSAMADLKVMASSEPRAVERAIRDYGYDMQLALGGVCMELLGLPAIKDYWLVAIESKRPYAIHVEAVNDIAIYWARCRLRRSIDTFARCLKEKDWPGYNQDGRSYQPTPYEAERMEKEQNSNLLPKDF